MLIKNIVLISLFLITDKLLAFGSLDKHQSYYTIPNVFIGNEFELNLGGKIPPKTLNDFHYVSSIDKYFAELDSENNLFDTIYLKLSRNRILSQIDLELDDISMDEYLQDNSRTEQILIICNELYGESMEKQKEYISSIYSIDIPLNIVTRNMLTLEWYTDGIKIEYFFLPRDRFIEIKEQLPENIHFWHILRLYSE